MLTGSQDSIYTQKHKFDRFDHVGIVESRIVRLFQFSVGNPDAASPFSESPFVGFEHRIELQIFFDQMR